MPFRDGTIPNTRSTHCALASQVKHTQGELSADRDRRETLYNNIGVLEPVGFQNASRFTGPSNTLRLPRRHTRVVSYARGQRVAQRCCLLRASALQPESLGSVLRVSCDSHAHDTRGV